MKKVTRDEANKALLDIICIIDNLALCGTLLEEEDAAASEAIAVLNYYIHSKEDKQQYDDEVFLC